MYNAMKSVTFSFLVLLNVVQFFLQIYNIHGICSGHYVPLVSMLLPGKSESRSLCERRNLTIEPTTGHIDIEVALYTVLKNAQRTLKKSEL